MLLIVGNTGGCLESAVAAITKELQDMCGAVASPNAHGKPEAI